MSGTPRSTRREFLRGQAAVDAIAAIGTQAVPVGELAEPAGDGYLVKYSRRAMACQFEIILNAGQYPRDSEAVLAALDLIDCLEGQLSVFRPESEVSRLNSTAYERPVVVEERLFDLLERAVALQVETFGAYDVTAGPLSDVWGFKRRSGSIPEPDALAAARARVGSQYLELDRETRSVRFFVPGIEINLGSIGKGYALDRAAEVLIGAGIDDFLLHGGNSSVVARGTRGGATPEEGWSVGVRNPLHPDRRAGELRLQDRGLSTSGSGTQFFVHGGKRYGHILDPRTGWPAEGVLSASVVAPTAAEADALSTALYVMGPALAADYCAARGDVSAILFAPGTFAGSFEKHCVAVGERDWIEVEAT